LSGAIVSSHGHEMSAQLIFEYTYLFGVRGVFLPWFLLKHHGKHVPHDDFVLIRTNLFQWLTAGALVGLAYIFSDTLCHDNAEEAAQMGTAATAILIGMLILSQQTDPLGMVIGLFTIEGGFTLVELLSPHAIPFPVHVGIVSVFVGLILTCGKYLGANGVQPRTIVTPSNETVGDSVATNG